MNEEEDDTRNRQPRPYFEPELFCMERTARTDFCKKFCMERTVRTISVRTVQMSIDHIQFQDQLAEPSIDKGSVTPKIV